jgi:hypothetical protein
VVALVLVAVGGAGVADGGLEVIVWVSSLVMLAVGEDWVGVIDTNIVIVGVSVAWAGDAGLGSLLPCPSAMAAIILPNTINKDMPTIKRLYSP